MKLLAISGITAAAMTFQAMCGAGLATPEKRGLTILLYNYAALPDGTVHDLTVQAGKLMFRVGIPLEWVECGGPAVMLQPEACVTVPQPERVVLRILTSCPQGGSSRGDVVGHAGGAFMSLCAAEILKIEKDNLLDHGSVMPYAAAHEIGHLLLGPAHGPSGIMRAVWGKAELSALERGRLNFSEAEAKTMRTVIAGAVARRADRVARNRPDTRTGRE
jgi:hypothetical protein